jgi:putative heme iron utilization protein
VAQEVRALLAQARHGVLATLSARRAGWPFASVVAFAGSVEGDPLLLLSSLAEHTRNLALDTRASLLVVEHAAEADPLAGGRVTLLGKIESVPTEHEPAARQRYLERHPEAREFFGMGDFRLYVLKVTEARYVGGFGDMGWLDRSQLL